MIVKQVTVSLENRMGSLEEILKILADNDINLTAINLADAGKEGVFRMMASEPEKAQEVLSAKGIPVTLVDVICIRVSHAVGSLYKAMKVLREGGINVDYMYALANGEDASAVMKCQDLEKAIQLLEDHEMGVFNLEDVYKYL